MTEKQTGYTMLIVGVVIMVVATLIMILVFIGVLPPISIGTISPSTVPELSTSQTNSNSSDLLNSYSPQLDILKLFSSDSFAHILNLSTTFFLMTFIGGFGYKIANLGVQLVRPIYVRTKNTTLEPENAPKAASKN